MSWLKEYQKSLKNLHAEEPLDVYFYRPPAFIIVKTFYRFPITPNHYSFLALLSGLAAGFNLMKGTTSGYQWGAFYFLLFAILDCCDGMVARLKKMELNLEDSLMGSSIISLISPFILLSLLA